MNEVKLLLLEDNINDVKLIEYELKRNKLNYEMKRVEEEEPFRKALHEYLPDIVISDYNMPRFNGLNALTISKSVNSITPFILITGSLNEETAVECMKAGADDYVLKENISRIFPSINNSIKRKKMLEEKTQAEKEIKHWKERYEFIANNAGHIIYEYDVENNKLIWSNNVESVLGYSKDELETLEQYIQLIHPSESTRAYDLYKKFIDKHGRFDFEFRFLHKLGHYIFIQSIGIVNGNGNNVIGLMQDVTERKLARLELIRAKENAEKSDKLKSEFLAQISHEIRTPLNTILSFTSLLKEELNDKLEDEDWKVGFRIIDNGGKRLIRTIDLLLNMSQIQSGNYEINLVELNLENILQSLTNDFFILAREKGLDIEFKKTAANENIIADQFSVYQIFSNLIDNAIKFTPKGKIEITLFQRSRNLCVQIKDTGVGISNDYLPNLFTPFSQEETGYTRKFDGNGLGLALVKKYADLNNAQIDISSKKGEGTCFIIVFNSSSNF